MNTIFKDTASQVKFAFTLAAHPGAEASDNANMVLAALHEAGTTPPPMNSEKLAELRDYAQRVLAVIQARLLPAQSAALVAKYGKNWADRRNACDSMRGHFMRALDKLLPHQAAVDKLVRKHYLVERDRSGAWSLEQIASAYGVAVHDVRQAWAVLVLYADQLERAAFDALERALSVEVAHG